MGNRALRKQAAEAIKSWGIQSKLYRGKAGRKRLKAHDLHNLIYKLSFKPGDLVNDCDAHNHVIKDLAYRAERGDKTFQCSTRGYTWTKHRRTRGYFFEAIQFLFEDGRFSCGCPASPDPALPREEIEKFLVSFYETEGVLSSYQEKVLHHLKSGGHIHDERGVLLPEWVRQDAQR